MDDAVKKLLKGLVAIFSLILTNEQLQKNTFDSNHILLLGVLSMLMLLYSSDQIIKAIQEVKTEKHLLTEGLISNVASEENTALILHALSPQRQDDSPIHLTSRETDILNFMADGLMNKEIAKRLFISDATVKNHITSILRKLNASVRTEAVVKAIKHGFVRVKNI